MTAAVSDRVQKQSDVAHWENKLKTEENGIEKQNKCVAVTQEEFKVCRLSLEAPWDADFVDVELDGGCVEILREG